MKVVIQGKQMKVSDELKQYVEDHLVKPMSRFYDDQAAELRVEFGDARPGKGGQDRECHLTLHMPHGRTLQVNSETQDAHASLDDAADRLIRVCKKELEKMREPAGHHVQHPLATAGTDEVA